MTSSAAFVHRSRGRMNLWRAQRATAICTGVLLLLTPVVGLSVMVANRALTAAWWTPVCVVLVAGAGLVLLAAARTDDPAGLRRATLVAMAAVSSALVLWFPASTGVTSAPDTVNPIWVTTTATIVAMVATAVFGLAPAVVFVTAFLSLQFVALSYAHSGTLLMAEFLRGSVNGAVAGLFMTVVCSAVQAARHVDADRIRVLSVAADSAALHARNDERARLDEVVRDDVIAVLRTVAPGRPDEVQREQARHALQALHGVDSRDTAGTVAAVAARIRLRETVLACDERASADVDVADDAGDYPSGVIEALVGAVGEAVANSVTHAGADSSRAVLGILCGERIRIRILDDGVGFVPRRVPADRMGIESGIRQRMFDVDGGSAHVDSVLGEGTTVSLEWVRP